MLRHCTMAELLELRDQRGSVKARAHLEQCDVCRSEFDRLHQRVAGLKALPSLQPPRDRWPMVRETVLASRRGRRNRRLMILGMAAAAGVLAMVGVRGVIKREPVVVAGPAPVGVESLVGESRRLEETLRAVERNGRVVDGLTASAIADLEDRIALIDAGIERATTLRASPTQVASLWQQRVALMDALVNVHVRQVAYEGF